MYTFGGIDGTIRLKDVRAMTTAAVAVPLREAIEIWQEELLLHKAMSTRDQLSPGEVWMALQDICIASHQTAEMLPVPLKNLYRNAKVRNRSGHEVNFSLSGLLHVVHESLALI